MHFDVVANETVLGHSSELAYVTNMSKLLFNMCFPCEMCSVPVAQFIFLIGADKAAPGLENCTR